MSRIAVTVIGTNLVMDYGTHEAAQEAMAQMQAAPPPLDGLRARIEALPGKWIPEGAYPGDHHGIDWVERDAVLAALREGDTP